MKPSRNPSALLSRRHLLGATAGTLALSLIGCGGGSDGIAGVGSGGTGSFSSGPIRGFGSILVGRIHYDESTAEIFDDAGRAMRESELRLGMVVDVNGSAVTTNALGQRRATANAIAVRTEIEGPVAAIDPNRSMITVLGQQVQITPSTVFDDFDGRGADALAVGQIVEISGLWQGPGRYTATRIELEDGKASHYKLRGVVSALDTEKQTLRMGDALISWANAGPQTAQLANGQFVRVELLPQADAQGIWQARAIDILRQAPTILPGSDDEVELEGYVASVSSTSQRFILLGVTVDYSQARFEDGHASDLEPGVRVEVEGHMSTDGSVLIAHEVEFEDDDDDDEIEVRGSITSVSPAEQTFVVRGVTVDYSQARFEDGTASDLKPGVRVEVEGRMSADGTVLMAHEIEFGDNDDELEIKGRISSVSPAEQTFVLRGITVDYSRARFEDGRASDLKPGVRVEVEGRMSADGTVLIASEVEFDD